MTTNLKKYEDLSKRTERKKNITILFSKWLWPVSPHEVRHFRVVEYVCSYFYMCYVRASVRYQSKDLIKFIRELEKEKQLITPLAFHDSCTKEIQYS